jgi:hypothetical protein
MDIELIHNMYHYYDSQFFKYKKFFNEVSYSKEINSQSDTNSNIIEFYNKKNKIILKASYQFLGRYFEKDNIWKWGWCIDMHKNLNYFIKKIFDYGFNLNTVIDNKNPNKIISLIKKILTNSIIKIINIEFILALSLYITKADFIYENKINNEWNCFLLKNIEIL